jgi:hypothetical protein
MTMTRKELIAELADMIKRAERNKFQGGDDMEIIDGFHHPAIDAARQAGWTDVADRAVAAFRRTGWPV